MTYEELAERRAITEIDDVRHALTIMNEISVLNKEMRMFRVAELLANLREYYVEIGRDLQKNDGCGTDGR